MSNPSQSTIKDSECPFPVKVQTVINKTLQRVQVQLRITTVLFLKSERTETFHRAQAGHDLYRGQLFLKSWGLRVVRQGIF